MGAWSIEPFGNDDACDWAYGLEGKRDLSVVEAALDAALADGYLEVPQAAEAVAAVEVLAKLLGRGTQSDSYTSDVDAWVASLTVKPDAALLAKARQALERVLGEDSEMRQLWDESGAEQWLASMDTLQRALLA